MAPSQSSQVLQVPCLLYYYNHREKKKPHFFGVEVNKVCSCVYKCRTRGAKSHWINSLKIFCKWSKYFQQRFAWVVLSRFWSLSSCKMKSYPKREKVLLGKSLVSFLSRLQDFMTFSCLWRFVCFYGRPKCHQGL